MGQGQSASGGDRLGWDTRDERYELLKQGMVIQLSDTYCLRMTLGSVYMASEKPDLRIS